MNAYLRLVLLATIIIFAVLKSFSYSQEPVLMPGWPVSFFNGSLSPHLTFYDLDHDGVSEIIFGNRGKIQVYDYHGNSMPGWPYIYSQDGFAKSPVIGDIDGDGYPEIVNYCSDGMLVALNNDATMCDGFPVEIGNSNSFCQMALYDLDGDDELEIIGGRVKSYPDTIWQVFVFNGDGEPFTGWPVDGVYIHGGIAVGDIDNDNSPDIVISGSDFEGNDLFAFDSYGAIKNGFPVQFDQSGTIYSVVGPPVLFDIEGDGELEIAQIISRIQSEPYYFKYCSVGVLDNNGEMIDPWPLNYSEHSDGGLSLCINPGSPDYYLSFGSVFWGHFYLSDINAQLVPGWPFYAGDPAAGNYDQPSIGDIDGDGSVDYIFNYNMAVRDSYYVWHGRIWALNQDGQLLEHFPLWVLGTTFPGSVTLGDVDSDGITEMAFKTDYPNDPQYLYLFKLTGIPYQPERFPWPMSCHDPQHTNNLNFRIPVSVEDERTENIPAATGITGIYPNPFNTAATIEYRLDEPAEISIEIFNLLGRKVVTLVDGRVEAGRHSVKWDASLAGQGQAGLSSGIYFARLSSGDDVSTRKMVLAK
jgi:hypothetical protein